MNTIGNLLTNLRTLLCCVRETLGYALIFLWAIFCPKAVLAAKLLAVESQLAVCKHQIGQRKRQRPRFTASFRLLWVMFSKSLDKWEYLVHLMQPATVRKWHTTAFRYFWRWKSRRKVVHFAITRNPFINWVVQQLRESMPFGLQPKYLFRDNDGIYGNGVRAFLESCGIKEVRTAYRSPWQNPFVERYIGTLRRELLDHVIVFSQSHLERLLREFIEEYYHMARPHQGLNGNTPVSQIKQPKISGPSKLISIPVLEGLHHRYVRVAA